MVIIDSFQGLDLTPYEGNSLSQGRCAGYGLKDLAKKKDVAIIVAYKVGKTVETSRADHRPLTALDMRIANEYGVDIAGFLYRDEFYNFKTCEQGIADLIIEKGATLPIRTTIKLRFDSETLRFYDIE